MSSRLRSKVGVGARDGVGVASVCGLEVAPAFVVTNKPVSRNNRMPVTIKAMARCGDRFFLSAGNFVVMGVGGDYFSMETARDESEEYPKNVMATLVL